MKLRPSSLAAVVLMLGVAACGGSENTPDAEPPIDATVDAVPPPDAYVCPFMECGTPGDPDTCIDTSQDELNCGACDMACQGGAICDTSNCECPAAFLAANHTATGFDVFQGTTTRIAIGPEISGGGINALVIGYDNPGTILNVEVPLTDAMPGTPPFAAALFNVDAQNQTAEAAYYAVSGSIEFTAACADGVAGTLTDVTFQGAVIFPAPMIDPDGCTFTMPSINFVIGADCMP